MYRFHITVHARSRDVGPGAVYACEGRRVRALCVPPPALAEPLGVTFEAAAAQLALLPRMYVEPDGSFVWVSSSREKAAWQVEGNLYDRAGSLMFVDLGGACPSASFDQLLRCCGWPDTPLMFQLTRQALFLDEHEFRQFAQAVGTG